MDWTGGTRRRFAGAKNNNTALQRQKARFSKARAASDQEPLASHLHRPSSSAVNKPTQMEALGVQHHRRLRLGASAQNGDPRIKRSRELDRNTSVADEQDTGGIQREGVQSIGSGANTHIRNDEELMLLATRRKLLARSDWLALDPTRPLRIEFPTASDNDRVGRRKKMKKSSARASRPAQQRLVTPLFEDRLDADKTLMSGALPPPQDELIEIKIGTSAFDSQSRPSRRSNMSRNVSTGPQSTSFSEVSMLLGADGDTFDADQVEVPPFLHYRHATTTPVDSEGSTSSYGERMNAPDLRICSSMHGDQTEATQYAAWPVREDMHTVAEHVNFPGDRFPAVRAIKDLRDDEVRSARDFTSIEGIHPAHRLDTAMFDNQDAPDSDAEDAWKRLMGITMQFQSSTSNKALDSSSEHITTSENTCPASLDRGQHEAGACDMTVSTPRGGRSNLDHCDWAESDKPFAEPASLTGQVPLAATARSPHNTPHSIEDDANGEALWREFIIGSQESDSGDELHSAWQRNRKHQRSSSKEPPYLQLSGLGTSDKATEGATIVNSPAPVAFMSPTKATQLENQSDSLGDLFLAATPAFKDPRNIHALSAQRKDPRRPKRSGIKGTDHDKRPGPEVSPRYALRRDTRISRRT